jgi:hypothetical protein
MTIQGATILAAGANRGFGPAFVRATLERSARKTGAVAGRPEVVTLPEGMPVWMGTLEAGACEVVANETSRVTKARLSTEAAFYLALTTV